VLAVAAVQAAAAAAATERRFAVERIIEHELPPAAAIPHRPHLQWVCQRWQPVRMPFTQTYQRVTGAEIPADFAFDLGICISFDQAPGRRLPARPRRSPHGSSDQL
jgi:hypothetical protein